MLASGVRKRGHPRAKEQLLTLYYNTHTHTQTPQNGLNVYVRSETMKAPQEKRGGHLHLSLSNDFFTLQKQLRQ